MNQTPTHQALAPEYRLLVLLVSIGFFMQGLDTTIVNTALPAMAASLNEDPLQMHSVVVAYVLAVAACIPLSGWLADRFGVRNTYFSAIIIFTLASLGCGFSESLNELLFYRVLTRHQWCIIAPCWPFSHAQGHSADAILIGHEFDESRGTDWPTDRSNTRGLVGRSQYMALDFPD